MFTIWTENVKGSPAIGIIVGLPISEWRGEHLVFDREDGTGIVF